MIGQSILHYKILQKLGEGGMGVVYKAEDTKLKRDVAIKFLPRQIAASGEERERFKIEAQAAAAINHPNIAAIYAIEEVDGDLFIVMEYVEGRELREIIHEIPPDLPLGKGGIGNLPPLKKRDRGKFLRIKDILDYATQTAAGLQAAHEKGVTHRDIKSANIMITDKGQVKIMDLRSGIPMELERIVNKCLEKTPAQRYQHVDELLVDLRAVSKRFESRSSKEPKTLTNPVSRKRLYPLAGLSILAAILLLVLYFWPAKGNKIDSIAVLPLQNLSGDPDREFFADGLTESLIMELSKISALRVISRQSVMRYKRTDKSMPEIARELNVDAVVEGSALRIGDEVRITVQLIQAEPEQHLWAEQYDRPMQDILRLQSDVAQAIAKKVKIVVTPEESQRLVRTAAVNPDALEFYLKGRFYLDKLEKTSLRKAIESFQNAIDIEKEYALAYVGQAEAYGWLVHLGEIPPSDGFQKEKELALQAIDIGGELAEAYTRLGEVSEWALWDWETAGKYLEKAIALNRNYARAHSGYAWYLLRRRGQTDQALNEIGIAYGLDPYSNRIKFEYGLMLYLTRRYEDAIRVLQELLEVSPDYRETLVILGLSCMRIGRYQDAIKQIQGFTALTGDTLTALSYMIPVYAAMGDTMKARELLNDYMLRLKETKVSMFGKEAPTVARVYAALNEKDKAFDWLEKAYNERNRYLAHIKIDPQFDPLRSDPRYKALLRKMGLEP